jgi:hypothetical protein
MLRAISLLGAGVALLAGGCAVGPLQDNPMLLGPRPTGTENPVYLPNGPASYNLVFTKVLDLVDDYFPEIAYANRYDGRIESFPRIAPGLGEPWKPGSPDFYQRTLATLQTIRHRAIVTISAADDGGFFVDVKVFKELEDIPAPTRATASAAAFRSESPLERQYEVIDETSFETAWIPIGRDLRLEQEILTRIAHFDLKVGTPDAGARPAGR